MSGCDHRHAEMTNCSAWTALRRVPGLFWSSLHYCVALAEHALGLLVQKTGLWQAVRRAVDGQHLH